jgi:threonine/homoserine/homoserine lactone efflux protein
MALRSYHRGMSPAVRGGLPTINRVQALVLGFLLMAWISLVAILIAAPAVYEQRLRSLPGAPRIVEIVFVAVLTAFIVLLSIGILRRWRWTFWLILVAFLFGVLRIPVAVLQLSGHIAPDGPPWYVILQGVIGVVQVLIALAMVLGYRRSGVWGS